VEVEVVEGVRHLRVVGAEEVVGVRLRVEVVVEVAEAGVHRRVEVVEEGEEEELQQETFQAVVVAEQEAQELPLPHVQAVMVGELTARVVRAGEEEGVSLLQEAEHGVWAVQVVVMVLLSLGVERVSMEVQEAQRQEKVHETKLVVEAAEASCSASLSVQAQEAVSSSSQDYHPQDLARVEQQQQQRLDSSSHTP
jgi:hypothetical protein